MLNVEGQMSIVNCRMAVHAVICFARFQKTYGQPWIRVHRDVSWARRLLLSSLSSTSRECRHVRCDFAFARRFQFSTLQLYHRGLVLMENLCAFSTTFHLWAKWAKPRFFVLSVFRFHPSRGICGRFAVASLRKPLSRR